MLLLISDANILIDIEIGGLIALMFRLEYQFAVPDILFYEELDGQHAHLLDMGLQPKELDEAMVARVSEFATKNPRPGRNDLFALVLAASEQCPLLTGDKNLKRRLNLKMSKYAEHCGCLIKWCNPARLRCMSPATRINSCVPMVEGYLGMWQKKCWLSWKLRIKCNSDKGENKSNGKDT